MSAVTGQSQSATCPVCRLPLMIRPATGRKSGKGFIMMLCPADGRHFRGFIPDQDYVQSVVALMDTVG